MRLLQLVGKRSVRPFKSLVTLAVRRLRESSAFALAAQQQQQRRSDPTSPLRTRSLAALLCMHARVHSVGR
jgi:hypothetical protein